MTTKKQQAHNAKVKKLTRELELIYAGACGASWNAEEDVAWPELLQDAIPAVCETYDIPLYEAGRWILSNLDKWADVQELAALLIEEKTLLDLFKENHRKKMEERATT